MSLIQYSPWILLIFVPETDSIYAGDASLYLKYKIVNLIKDLTMHGIINVRRIQHFLELYTMDDGFFIGKAVFSIRSKFTRMIRLYLLCYNNLDEFDRNEHIVHLLEIQHLAMEIDNLIEMIHDYTWPTKKRKSPAEKFLGPGQTLPADFSMPEEFGGRLRSGKMTTQKVLFKRNDKNYNEKIVRHNIAGKRLIDGRNTENNGGGFDSDIN